MLISEEGGKHEDGMQGDRPAGPGNGLRAPSHTTKTSVEMLFSIQAEKDPKRRPAHECMRGAAVAFADKHLRRRVTLPGSLETDAEVNSKLDSGDRLDVVSCAVRGCSWSCSTCPQGHEYESGHPFDSELRKHVQEHHGPALCHLAATCGIAAEEIASAKRS